MMFFTDAKSRSGTGDGIAPCARVPWRHWLQWGLLALLLGVATLLSACATGPKWVNHAFGFNVEQDSPEHEVLAYRYGTGAMVATSSDTSLRQFGRSRQGANVNGPMPLGDSLYVKWRYEPSGQTFEDTVDLRPLLPRDMTLQRIYFVVKGPQLYVYLINPAPRPPDWPAVGPKKFQNEKILQIYPS